MDMELTISPSGFEELRNSDKHVIVWQSHAVDPQCPSATDNPGSSYLWINAKQEFSREEVNEIAIRMLRWVHTGSLKIAGEKNRAEQKLADDLAKAHGV